MNNYLLMLFAITLLFSCTSQTMKAPNAIDTLKVQSKNESNIVSFVTKIHIDTLLIDGFYINGYIVELDYTQAKKISDKKVRITGEVTLVKGLESDPEYLKGIQKGGRLKDAKHIYNPKFEIWNNYIFFQNTFPGFQFIPKTLLQLILGKYYY